MRSTAKRAITAGLALTLALSPLQAFPTRALAEGDDDAPLVDDEVLLIKDEDPDDARLTDIDNRALAAEIALSQLLAQGTIGSGEGLTSIDAQSREMDEAAQLSARVEQFSAQYQQARKEVDSLQTKIDENGDRIAKLEAELPELKARAGACIRALYKFHESNVGLVDLLLSSDSFYDFMASIQYLESIQQHNTSVIEQLMTTQQELEETRDELMHEKRESDKRLVEAERALAEAEAAREEARRLAAEKAAREAAEAEAALEAARAAATSATNATFVTSSGNETQISIGTNPGQASITPNEIDAWAGRIDAYLAGSPLAGHGRTFAEAALTSGVDPRWSPSISCIESSKGRYCFKPYNAWGWGQSVWPDWDTAIRAHVSGLASGYGYSITVSAAKKYCPPNWAFWYSGVSAEMCKI